MYKSLVISILAFNPWHSFNVPTVARSNPFYKVITVTRNRHVKMWGGEVEYNLCHFKNEMIKLKNKQNGKNITTNDR